MKLHVVNNSEVGTFRQCPKRWGFRYAEGLVSKDRGPIYFDWGTVYHKGKEAIWKAVRGDGALTPAQAKEPLSLKRVARAAMHQQVESWCEEMGKEEWAEQQDRLDMILAEATWAVEHYIDQRQMQLQSWVPLAVEQKLVMIMGGGLRYFGTPDLVFYDPDVRDIVVEDGKTTASDVNSFDHRLQLDTQSQGYVPAVRDAVERGAIPRPQVDPGALVSGRFIWDVAKRKVASTPKVKLLRMAKKYLLAQPKMQALTDTQEATGEPQGMVSTAPCDTLPRIYLAAMDAQRDRGLEVTEEQVEFLQVLKSKGDTFLQATETHVEDRQIEEWARDFRVDTQRIRAARKDPSLRTRNSLACSLPNSPPCPYREPCINPDAREMFTTEGK